MKQIRFSKKGLEELKIKFERLKSERPSAVLDLKKARDMGDLSENGYYKSARSKLAEIDRNLRYFGYQLKNAFVTQNGNKDRVGIGSKVKLLGGEKELNLEVVGDVEANPGQGKISLLSPMGEALEGKREGEIVEIRTPNGNTFYKIIKIGNF